MAVIAFIVHRIVPFLCKKIHKQRYIYSFFNSLKSKGNGREKKRDDMPCHEIPWHENVLGVHLPPTSRPLLFKVNVVLHGVTNTKVTSKIFQNAGASVSLYFEWFFLLTIPCTLDLNLTGNEWFIDFPYKQRNKITNNVILHYEPNRII